MKTIVYYLIHTRRKQHSQMHETAGG